MKKNQLFIIFLVVVVLLLAILFLGSLFTNKGTDVPPSEENKVEQPNETPSGFSFSQDEKIKLIRDKEDIYLLGNTVRKVDWAGQSLSEAEYLEKVFDRDGLSYAVSEGKLLLLGNGENTVMADDVRDYRVYDDKLLYLNSTGIALFHYDKKVSQQLMESAESEDPLKLEDIHLIDHGRYFAHYDEATGVTEINLTETLEHVFNFDGKISSASWTNDSFLFEDLENLNRIGYYSISNEEISKFSLTTDNEKVLYSPHFDEHGMVRYLTDKEGTVQLNKLDVQTQMVKKIATTSRLDFVKEDMIDGYYVLQFKDRFYYSKDDVDYNFYTLPNDQLAFSENHVYVSHGTEMKAIKGDSFKAYSLKGKPLSTLATDTAFYYTYVQDGKQWLDRIDIDL